LELQSQEDAKVCQLTLEDAKHLKLTCSKVLTGLPAVEELERPARSVIVEIEAVVLVEETCCRIERPVNLKSQVEKKSCCKVEERRLGTWAALFIYSMALLWETLRIPAAQQTVIEVWW
jgi:hypothetical protein